MLYIDKEYKLLLAYLKMENEKNQDKPYVYFVKKDYRAFAPENQDHDMRITSRLSNNFTILPSYELSEETIELVREDLKKGINAVAMITHLPFDSQTRGGGRFESKDFYYKRVYGKARSNLLKINTVNPLMPIIAYTGGDQVEEFRSLFLNLDSIGETGKGMGPVKEIVFKSHPNEWEKDAMTLERLLTKFSRSFIPLPKDYTPR
jgi:hypothetical protein